MFPLNVSSIESRSRKMKGVVSKETVVLRRWGSSIQKFGFINGVDNVQPPDDHRTEIPKAFRISVRWSSGGCTLSTLLIKPNFRSRKRYAFCIYEGFLVKLLIVYGTFTDLSINF